MFALVLATLLAAVPKAGEAKALASEGNWDELYLRFAAAKPDEYPAKDRSAIADALLAASRGLANDDKVLALAAAETSARFRPKVATYLYAAALARGSDNPGQAAELLDKAIALSPTHGGALVARAELAEKENDWDLAARLYERVPPASPEAKKARAGARAARASLAARDAAQEEIGRIERDIAQGQPRPDAPQRPTAAPPAGPGESKSLGLDGMRVRESEHFHFVYSGEGKDFARRADYEGHVLDALEQARQFVMKRWGRAREKPVDVVLYTKEEYELHFGGSSLGRAAGFYSGKIRVSNAAEMTAETRAVILHEYVHAVVDELVGGKRVPAWLQEGAATLLERDWRGRQQLPYSLAVQARGLAIRKALPPLASLESSIMEHAEPWLTYHVGAAAVQELIDRHSLVEFLELLREIGRGTTFPVAFDAYYAGAYEKLDEAVREAIQKR